MTEFLQQLINGLSLGAIYALIALGYTMVYGVLRFINFAHADVFMIGSFVGCYVGRTINAGTWWGGLLVILAAMVACAIIGGRIQHLAYRPLREKSEYDLVTTLSAIVLGVLGAFGAHALLRTGNSEYARLLIVLAAWAGAELGGFLGKFSPWKFIFHRTAGNAPVLNVLITAIGVSLFLQYGGQVVFGANPKTFPQVFPPHHFHLGGIDISSSQVVVIAVTIVLLCALWFVVHRTRIGTAMRAVSLNPQAAQLVGINTNTVFAFTFILGSALAGAGGVLYAMNYPSIDPLMGIMPGLKAFVAAILGGIGSIPGAALGGLIIGSAETLVGGSQWSTYKDAIAFGILIIIMLFRPAGLLGRATVEKV